MTLNNIQYDNVMRLYSRKRSKNAAILEKRMAEISSKIPEYDAVESEIASLSVNAMRSRLRSGTGEKSDPGIEDLKFKLNALNNLKLQYLTDHGYPEDYLNAIYDCPLCKDTGIINESFCKCFKKAVTDIMIQRSGIESVLERENFNTLTEEYYSPNYIDPSTGKSSLEMFRDALVKCRNFISDFSTNFSNLFLYGDTGVGKTFLSNCIACELLKQGYSVVYMTSSSYFETMASLKFYRTEDESLPAYDYIDDCDLLIIDDLGTELSNKFTASEFFTCINNRLLKRKSTIISTNLKLDQISEMYTERVFSRIMSDYTLLKLVGDDIRIKKKLKSK